MVGFEVRSINQPYTARKQLVCQHLSDNKYQVTLPDDYDEVQNRIIVNFDDYSEICLRSR